MKNKKIQYTFYWGTRAKVAPSMHGSLYSGKMTSKQVQLSINEHQKMQNSREIMSTNNSVDWQVEINLLKKILR